MAIDDFDDGYGDPSDYGMSQQDFDDASAIGQATYSGDSDQLAQAIANSTARTRSGSPSRSNITNLVDSSGNSLYDPQFAAAFDISRGLDPTNNMGGTGGLAVPSYLRPQLTGDIASDFRGSYNQEPKYYSPVERVMQTDLAEIAQSGPGLIGLVGRGLDSLFSGLDFLNNSKAGKTVEEIAEEEKRIEIADLEKERLDSLVTAPIDRVKKSNLDPILSNVPPNPVMVNQIQRDIAKSRGIFDLPQAADLQNQQIAAGTNAGKTLNPELPVSFPYGRSGGYNMSVLSSRGDAAKPNPIQGPPNPFVNDIVSPISRPFATTDEVALQRGTDGYYFANASNRKLDIPERISNFTFPTLTEAQVRASDDAGYSFEPTTNLATLGLQRDNTEFIEKANLPPELQGIVGLNTDLDYGQTTPLSVLLENTPLAVTARDRAFRKEQEKKDKEIAEAEAFRKFRASLSPSTRIGGGYGGVNEPVRPNYSSSFTPSLPPLY